MIDLVALIGSFNHQREPFEQKRAKAVTPRQYYSSVVIELLETERVPRAARLRPILCHTTWDAPRSSLTDPSTASRVWPQESHRPGTQRSAVLDRASTRVAVNTVAAVAPDSRVGTASPGRQRGS